MDRTELEKLMEKHCIVDSEIESVFAFVYDVVKMERDRMKTEEPHAINSIRDTEKAMSVIDDIGMEVEEALF